MTDTNAISRLSAVVAATGLVLALAECTAPLDGTPVASPSTMSTAPSLPRALPRMGSDATDSPAAQSLLEQLPIRTSLESVLKHPENVDFNELYASCFVRNGVVEAPFGGEGYRKALETAAPDGVSPPRARPIA